MEENLDKSLGLLGLDYVDLYLIHWPIAMNPDGNHEKFPKLPDGSRDLLKDRSHIDTYKDMEKLLKGGKVKAIGVCNYSRTYLEELLPKVNIVPAVNQIENHPLLPQQEIVDLCNEKGILITAYSPLGSTGSPLMKDEHVVKLAKEKSTTPGSILLSYHSESISPSFHKFVLIDVSVARGSSVLAKSVTPSRIEENMKVVKLSSQDVASLAEISQNGITRFVYRELFPYLDQTDTNRRLSGIWSQLWFPRQAVIRRLCRVLIDYRVVNKSFRDCSLRVLPRSCSNGKWGVHRWGSRVSTWGACQGGIRSPIDMDKSSRCRKVQASTRRHGRLR